MSTLAIVFGAISIVTLLFGVLAIINDIRNDDDFQTPWILLSLGSVGLWLCLTI